MNEDPTRITDPTTLTTAQLMHEIEVVKEMVFRENLNLEKLIGQRIAELEKATKVAHDDLVRVPTDVQKQVGSLKELHEAKFGERFERIEEKIESAAEVRQQNIEVIRHQLLDAAQLRDEKFAGVAIQFEATDKRADQTSKDAKTAVDVGLQAAKELVAEKTISAAQAAAKQEASFSKQIDAQGLLIQATAKASDEKIDDIKERLTRIEGTGSGRRDMWGWVASGIFLLIAIVTVILTVL